MKLIFVFALILFLIISHVRTRTIGPDMVARAKLARDLPLGRTLSGSEKVVPKSGTKTHIELNLALRSLDLDFSTGTFSVDGWMSLQWNDPRYGWEPSDYDDITSIPLPFSTTWAPEVILHNAVEEKFIFRQVGIVKHTGDFVYLISIHTKSACAPNYTGFPFGIQTCHLKFGSWVNEQYKVEYRAGNSNVATNTSAINLEEFNSPIGWNVIATGVTLESAHYPLFEEPSPMVVYTIAFKRDSYFDKTNGTLKKRDERRGNERRS